LIRDDAVDAARRIFGMRARVERDALRDRACDLRHRHDAPVARL
jgi:hypothetical protein